MGSLMQKLHERNIIVPPHYVLSGIQYETMMGSIAYGCNDNTSDIDVYGFCIPFKNMVFPHMCGEILGFGSQKKRFDQYEPKGIIDASSRKEYDIDIYNIVKYFQLCMINNPNMIDSLFTPQRCVLYSSKIGNYVRENRKLFLHKGAWHRFKGYAFAQMSKMKNKKVVQLVEIMHKYHLNIEDIMKCFEEVNYGEEFKILQEDYVILKAILKEFGNKKITKRFPSVLKFGYDVKFGYNVVRLLNEVEQIMVEHDLDLERNREQLKSIRRGEWTFEQIQQYFDQKERDLETLYTTSDLQHSPDEDKIKQILINCLEMHFGDLGKAIEKPKKVDDLVRDIQKVLNRYCIN